MSTLQIGLAITGGLVLAAVVAHSAWNSRKNSPRKAQTEPEQGVLTDLPLDPVLGETEFETGRLNLPLPETKPLLDALIDVIAPIYLDGPVSGDAAWASMPTTRRVGSKPFSIEGRHETLQHWELPRAGQRYDAFQAGVQLANRSGPLNEIEYSEFVMKTQTFADIINGTPDFPEMLDEVARARELDQFASSHDAELGFTLRALNSAWSPGYIQQNAARLGFVSGAIPGRMVLAAHSPGLPPVLVLSFDTQAALAEDLTQSAVREIHLGLDVAQVDRQLKAFTRMCETANALALAMDGVLIDDQQQPLKTSAIEGVAAELEKLYDTLDGHDLSAGSPLARRLFS